MRDGDLIKFNIPNDVLFHVISVNPWKAEWVDKNTYEHSCSTIYTLEAISKHMGDAKIVGNTGKSSKALDFYNRIK